MMKNRSGREGGEGGEWFNLIGLEQGGRGVVGGEKGAN